MTTGQAGLSPNRQTVAEYLAQRADGYLKEQAEQRSKLMPEWVPAGAKRMPYSMFDLFPVKYLGTWFTSIEHAMQASKTTSDREFHRIVRVALPAKARSIGRSITPYDGWEDDRYGIMQDLLAQRFKNPAQRRSLQLISPEYEFVYWNIWCDTYWGICICSSCKGSGINIFGALIDTIRLEALAELEGR